MTLRSKAMVAGFLGGILGAFAMDQFTRVWKTIVPDSKQTEQPPLPYSQQEWDSTSRTACRVAEPMLGRPLTTPEKALGAQVVHFAAGGVAGAAYATGIARRYWNPITSGVIFGAALWLVGEELAMPLLGINDPPSAYSCSMHLNSLGEHLAYGVTTALVSKGLTAIL